jgi:hypothetical protein
MVIVETMESMGIVAIVESMAIMGIIIGTDSR